MTKNRSCIARTALGPIEYRHRTREGIPKAQTIVTIHGAMGGHEQSDILGRAVGPSNYNYIAVSRPGYLQTALKGRKTPKAQADLIAALLDTLGLEKVIIMAISGGGYSALAFALGHPERCRALILCSTAGQKITQPVPRAFHIMRLAARVPWLVKQMRKKFDQNMDKSLRRSVTFPDLAEKMLNDPKMMAFFQELTHAGFDQMAKRMPGTMNDIRITRTTGYPLERIETPTLVVHGTHDPIVPFEAHGKTLSKRLPNSTLCLAQRGEHMTIFTHNAQVRQAVGDFLGRFFSS